MKTIMIPQNSSVPINDWTENYTLTKHWQSDLAFYKYELKFLRGLIKKYFIWLNKDENIQLVDKLAKRILLIDRKRKDINVQLKKHMIYLQELIDGIFYHHPEQFRDEHLKLQEEIAQFISNFRQVRKDVFLTTEQVIEEEKLQRLVAVKG